MSGFGTGIVRVVRKFGKNFIDVPVQHRSVKYRKDYIAPAWRCMERKCQKYYSVVCRKKAVTNGDDRVIGIVAHGDYR
jgi:hypothetical protein